MKTPKHNPPKNHPKTTQKTIQPPRAAHTKKTKPYFYGIHAVKALLDYRPLDALSVFVQLSDGKNDGLHAICEQAKALGISVQSTTKDKLTELCGSSQHQGVAVLSRLPSLADENRLDELCQKEDVLLLVLDQITDAHNLGACLRTACAMGADAVIVPKNQSATITPTVAKVSVGASEMIELISVTNLARALTKIKQQGVFVFGTALDETAKSLQHCDLTGKVAIVMGSEGDGMRRLTQELCDTLVYIPMIDSPHRPQSLNVSVATGMVLYEAMRQRQP